MDFLIVSEVLGVAQEVAGATPQSQAKQENPSGRIPKSLSPQHITRGKLKPSAQHVHTQGPTAFTPKATNVEPPFPVPSMASPPAEV